MWFLMSGAIEIAAAAAIGAGSAVYWRSSFASVCAAALTLWVLTRFASSRRSALIGLALAATASALALGIVRVLVLRSLPDTTLMPPEMAAQFAALRNEASWPRLAFASVIDAVVLAATIGAAVLGARLANKRIEPTA
jgi:hypothetical protein